jgi:hypothetical protein
MESLRPDQSYDLIVRRLMLSLEFIDPLGGKPIGKGLRVSADGLGPPKVIAGQRFVWLLDGEAEGRTYSVEAVSTDGRFRDFAGLVENVPANDDKVTPHLLGRRIVLKPTGLNPPPAGLMAVEGMLIDDGDPPGGIADAEIVIQLRDLGTQVFTAGYTAVSDARGGFVAAAPDFAKVAPTAAPPPAPERAVVGWLKIKKGGATQYSKALALRPGRVLTLAEPLILPELPSQEPPP